MVNLPASDKIFKNKLKNWETDKSYFSLPSSAKVKEWIDIISFELPQGLVESEFSSLHAWNYSLSHY